MTCEHARARQSLDARDADGSRAVASSVSPWQALTAPVLSAVVILVYRWSDRLSIAVLGRLSRQWFAVDLMQRTRAMDPLLVPAGSADRQESLGCIICVHGDCCRTITIGTDFIELK